jgi:hypothetical protein
MRGLRLDEARRARDLRRCQTEAECELWRRLRSRLLCGFKFVRQEPIGPYFVDLFAETKNLSWNSTARHIRPTMSAVAMVGENSSCAIVAIA